MVWTQYINLKGPQGASGAPGSDANVTSASIAGALGYTPESSSNKGQPNGYAGLDGNGRVPISQLPNSIMEYQGTYNASTNSPALTNGTGNTGDVYRVSVAGTRNFGAGNISFEVGDYVIYSGSEWQKSDTTDAVSTVAGLTGDVSASSLRTAMSAIARSVQTITTPTTLGAAANTDYVYFLSSGISPTTSGGAATYVAATGMNNWNYSGSAAQTKTFTHTTESSNYVLLFVHSLIFFNNGTPSATATFGGVPMTLIQPRFNCANEASGFLFGLSGNFSGSYTVSITMSGYNQGFRATSIAATYGNVISVETPVTGSTSVTVNSAENVVAFSGSRAATSGIALSGSTSRLAQQDASGSGDIYSQVIDVLSTSTANRTVTTSTGGTVGLVAVKLNAGISTPGTPTLPTAVGSSSLYTLKNISATPIRIEGTPFGEANFSSTVALLRGDGVNASTVISDSSFIAANWVVAGNAQLSTSVVKYGTASIAFDGNADYIYPSAPASNFAHGSGDFTIEMWVYPTSVGGTLRIFYEGRHNVVNATVPTIYFDTSGVLQLYVSGSNRISDSGATAANAWYHIVVCRSGTSTRMFKNGVQVGSTWTDTTSYTVAQNGLPLIGAGWADGAQGSYGFAGNIDDIRITKGVARYTSNFTAPTSALPGTFQLAQDESTRLISDGTQWRIV